MMDRTKANLPKAQIGFLEFVIEPFFKDFCEMDEGFQEIIKHVARNKARWKELLQAKG